MGTLTEEIFSRKLGRPVKAGEIVWCDVDYVMSHDTMTVLAIKAMKELATEVFDPDKVVILFDHIVPAATIDQAIAQREAINFVKEQGITHFYQEGVCHQVMVEKALPLPGSIVIGSDSHTCTYGALGCFSTGMGATDIGVAYAKGKTWFRIPETILVKVEGELPEGVFAKDLILKIVSAIGLEGANYMAIEFEGPAITRMSIPERMTLCNMAIEMGAKAGLIAADDITSQFLLDRGVAKVERLRPSGATYMRSLTVDASSLGPLVACPHDLDNLKPVEEVEGTPIDEVFIGTCTNGRYEDLLIAALILRGRHVSKFTRTIIVPASSEVYKRALADGLIKIFADSGAIVCNPGCGPCLGRHQGVLAPGERAFTTMNRNFRGRMGSPESEIYVGSPATAAATAIYGKITDPRKVI